MPGTHKKIETVADVRGSGVIGAVEMKQIVNMKTIQQSFVDDGVWARPFGKLIYLMPAFVINTEELKTLTNTVINVNSES